MRKILAYTALGTKRALRYAPFIFLITLIISLCLSSIVVALTEENEVGDKNTKLKIAVVGEISDSYLGFGLSTIQSFDSSQYTLELIEMDEESARTSLARGELAGAIIVPEGFIDEAISGNVGKITFLTRQTGVDIVTLFKQELLDMVSCVLVGSQNGVYAMEDVIIEYSVEYDKRVDHMNALTVEYLSLILNRSNASKMQVIGISDNLSLGGYVLSAAVVVLLLLTGISCAPIFVHRSLSLQKLLSSRRCGPAAQILCEYVAFLIITLINFALIIAVVVWTMGDIVQFIPEISAKSSSELVGMALDFIPAIILVSAMQFLLFELSDSVVSGVLLQFFASIGLGYVSGCFYPISFFPDVIRTVSSVLPPGIARGYLATLVSGADRTNGIIMIAVSAAVLLVLTVLMRRRKLRCV